MALTLDPVPTPPDEPTGYYATLADCQAVAGASNLATYSNLDGGQTIDNARVQNAMTQTDAEIDLFLKTNGVTNPAPTTDPSFSLLTQAAAYLVTLSLYRSRGERDVDAAGNVNYAKENTWRKIAKDLMTRYVSGQRQTLTGQYMVDNSRTHPGYWPF